MKKLDNPEYFDRILSLLLEKHKINNSINGNIVKSQLFNELDKDEATYMIKKMVSTEPNIFRVFGDTNSQSISVSANGLTQGFLDEGGFVGLYNKENKDYKDQKYKQQLEIDIKELQKENLEYERSIRSLNEELKISSLIKNYWWLIASAIGVGIVIGEFLV